MVLGTDPRFETLASESCPVFKAALWGKAQVDANVVSLKGDSEGFGNRYAPNKNNKAKLSVALNERFK